jgi:hypothetical protein
MSTTPNDTTPQSQQTGIDMQLSHEICDAWISACEQVDLAYRSWSQVADGSRADAYAAYVANLDREEAAARHLRSSIETSFLGASWARLLTIGAQPPHGGPSTGRPDPGDPPRRQEST